jgi:hypothetical protein
MMQRSYRTKGARLRACLGALLLAACAGAAQAHAQDGPRALVICGKCVIDADVAVEREVRRAVDELKRFQLAPPQRIDFEAVQIGLDCSEENARCLRAAADKLAVDVLFVATLSRHHDSSSLRVLYFDVSRSEPRSVTRSRNAAGSERKWRGELPAMLSELLADAPHEPVAVAAGPAATPAPAPAGDTAALASTPSEDAAPPAAERTANDAARPARSAETSPGWLDSIPTAALVLGGGGLVAIGAGLVVGAAARATESTYRERVIDTPVQAEAAERDRERGEREALIANLLLGTGAAALVGAGVWLVLDRKAPERGGQIALAPTLGPDRRKLGRSAMTRTAALSIGVLALALLLAGCTFDEHANPARGCGDDCAPGACYLGYCLERLEASAAEVIDPPTGVAGATSTPSGASGAGASGAAAATGGGGASQPVGGSGGSAASPGCASATASEETCNGLDDDCDGALDEATDEICYPAGVAGCVLDATGGYQCTGLCATGVRACAGGQLGACASAVQPKAELCGGVEAVDENCDGAVDDGCPCTGDETQRCYSGRAFSAGIGPCRSGTQRCVNGELGACEGEVVPTAESCANPGADDDCDFLLDDVAGAGTVCFDLFASGVCGSGLRRCAAGALTCVTPEPQDDDATCDGRDEDCDGAIDEDFDLDEDPDNCGACGVLCGTGEVCCDGTCRDLDGDEQHCGACGRSCEGELSCCDGACVAIDTEAHCGGCGVCAADEACCDGVCLVTNTDDHCGHCEVACGEGCTCQDGTCMAGDAGACP